MVVSMVGPPKPTTHESQKKWFGNPSTLYLAKSVHTA
jgi:hypothetical protein